MKHFVLRLLIFVIPLGIFAVCIFMLEGGFSDAYYLRLTTSKQKSLVLGTSRAAQGIMPDIVSRNVSEHYSHPVFNYAFTVTHSPYGDAYYASIKNKLDSSSRDGLFIATIDPWSLCVKMTSEDELVFTENDSFIDGVENVSMNPNLDYLLNYYPEPFYNIIFKRLQPGKLRLHDNGWLEVSIKMDSLGAKKRKERQLKRYAKRIPNVQFSETRFAALQKTIELLKRHGDVYLVRLPIDVEMASLEDSLNIDFNNRMKSLETQYKIPYLDMTMQGEKYLYTDGHHLFKKSSRDVSEAIGKWIANLKKSKSTYASSSR
jgi:hypothetical protein